MGFLSTCMVVDFKLFRVGIDLAVVLGFVFIIIPLSVLFSYIGIMYDKCEVIL